MYVDSKERKQKTQNFASLKHRDGITGRLKSQRIWESDTEKSSTTEQHIISCKETKIQVWI